MNHALKQVLAIGCAVVLATPAFAHSGHGTGFPAGVAHPFSGADHVLAMIAVGLWAAMRGGRAVIAWPLAFVIAMFTGFVAAQGGYVVPKLEPMILSTVIVLGAVIALGLNASIIAGAALVGFAGALHGFAHGLEVQGALVPFASGFVVATALLHAAGIGVGLVVERAAKFKLVRLVGFGIMAGGVALAFA